MIAVREELSKRRERQENPKRLPNRFSVTALLLTAPLVFLLIQISSGDWRLAVITGLTIGAFVAWAVWEFSGGD